MLSSTRSRSRSCDWCVRLLDGRVVHKAPDVAFLTYDDEHRRIAIAESAAIREVGAEALVGDSSSPAALSPTEIAALLPHGLAHTALSHLAELARELGAAEERVGAAGPGDQPRARMRLTTWGLILTRTPAGVGLASGSYLKTGDTVEVANDGFGHLRNAVTARVVTNEVSNVDGRSRQEGN